jgi:glucokinase
MTTLAVDFGGRRIKLGLLRDGVALAVQIVPAQADEPLATRLTEIASHLGRLCADNSVLPSDCQGIGFAYPSIIDTANARILDHFGKFGDASQLDLRTWADTAFGIPLAIDNDARMALIGEWRYGAGRGCDNLVIMTLGTGLGASALIEGEVLRGVHGQAGILGGHMTLNYHGNPCVCGNVGCSEVEASTWMLKELAPRLPSFASSPLSRENEIDYAAVFKLAGEGDACAQSLRDHSLKVWGATAVNLIHAYDPEKLLLTGGVLQSGDIIVPAVQEWVSRHAHTPWGKVQIARGTLGDQAALLACEWLVSDFVGKEKFANQ